MAVIRTLLNNGSKTCLLHVYMESEGHEGELKNYVLADPELFDSVFTKQILQPNMKLTISQVWHSFTGFDALLSFDALTPYPSWVLTPDSQNYVDFRYFGGLAHRVVDPQTNKVNDRTGKLLLSTDGFAPVGSMGTLVIEIRKSLD